MNTVPKISVIVPVYNSEKYLHKCIDSILTQTFTDFELLLINDGSKDSSGDICNEYLQKDNRIKVFHQENRGPAVARNIGIENVIGEWVSFVDADDWLSPNTYEEYLSIIKDTNSDIIVSGQIQISENSIPLYNYVESKNYKEEEILDCWIDLNKKNLNHYLWNKLYKTKVIKNANIKFKDLRMAEDTFFNIEYFMRCHKISVIDKCLYFYRTDNSQSISKGFKKDWILVSQLFEDYYNRFLAYSKGNKQEFLKMMATNRFYYQGSWLTFNLFQSSIEFKQKRKTIQSLIMQNVELKNIIKKQKPPHIYDRVFKWLVLNTNSTIIALYYSAFSFLRCQVIKLFNR